MKTFQDLIRDGIAPNRYDQVYIGATTNSDPLVRGYNNVWGVISDTHMASYGEGQYIITGSLVKDQTKFSSFLYAYAWGGYGFNAAATTRQQGTRCLQSYLSKNGLVGSFSKVNNDDVYLLTPVEQYHSVSMEVAVCGDACSKRIGESWRDVTNNQQALYDLVSECHTIQDAICKLNESQVVKGHDWSVCVDVEGTKFVNENNKYILVNIEEAYHADSEGLSKYLNTLKGKSISLDKLSKELSKHFNILRGDLDFDFDKNLLTICYNFSNNLEGSDQSVILKLTPESRFAKLEITDVEFE